MDSDISFGSELPPERRGPSALVALGGFVALVAVAIVVIASLVGLARLLERTV